ncbi:RNA polymerase sigma factor [Caulobacter mirabilis]|uniref:RNA polymerase subunit sigma-24 n=1 Tax=Caulobacter mirabilis TaxID=69666 RepID=A0A2D2B0V7_9CAUL|nr:sigma-70 family RNA polymerase sigma factor [Caulobacter mirabilis]ATQ43889.1 RNA polymerase subunit sigma-24 [Caulobacter mirabilis]
MTAWRTGLAEHLRGDEGRVIEGDDALAALSQRARPALLRYFRRRGLSAPDAEDAVQDVFLRLSRRPDVAVAEHGEAYLFETAASVAIDRHRRSRARREDRHTSYDEALHAVADHPVDRVVEGRQELRRFIDSLRQLPERTRHVVLLARLERLTHVEIARRLGVSVSTVERRLVKGMAYLAARLREEAGR